MAIVSLQRKDTDPATHGVAFLKQVSLLRKEAPEVLGMGVSLGYGRRIGCRQGLL